MMGKPETDARKIRVPSPTTITIRAFGRLARLRAELQAMQEAEEHRRGNFDRRVCELQRQIVAADADYGKIERGELSCSDCGD